ncbi:RidA family protein [Labrenzia sp. PHM005]|uniref:RidA family protein n=1 Tax=Labrenzia sp. PHM005 TaxID=2590016 RepID=UPI0011403048|nr:RidA family protein [Labrenzia sp. PHM005]QDG76961.1 RidA family protein [Labrenzia sp. PHM005]
MIPLRNNIPELGPVIGPYTHAVFHGNTLYTSGLTAFGTDSQAKAAGAQASAILDQLTVLAESCGSSMKHLVKVTVFAVDPADIPDVRDVLTERYGKAVPASSLVLVSGLFSPDLRLEMEAIFALESSSQPMA